MRKNEIVIGQVYFAKVSGERVHVRVDSYSDAVYKTRPWLCTNMKTGREVRKSSAALSTVHGVSLSERACLAIANLYDANARLFPEMTLAEHTAAVRAKWPTSRTEILVAAEKFIERLVAGSQANDRALADEILEAAGAGASTRALLRAAFRQTRCFTHAARKHMYRIVLNFAHHS
jgi:hypothetical protein